MSMRKLLDSEEKVKYSGFWAVIGMFWAFSAQAQMPYLDEVKALGAVAGQGMRLKPTLISPSRWTVFSNVT